MTELVVRAGSPVNVNAAPVAFTSSSKVTVKVMISPALKGEAGEKVADWKVAGMVVSCDGAVRAGGHFQGD